MTQFETVRIYRDPINRWTAHTTDSRGRDIECITQWEHPYTEFRYDGSIKQTGTEDFSIERERNLNIYRVFQWNGVNLNRGGHRKFSFIGYCTINKADKQKAIHVFKARHPENYVFELR